MKNATDENKEKLDSKIEDSYYDWLKQVRMFAGDDAEDLLLDMIGYFYEHNICPETNYYVIKSCKISYYSKNSPYNRKREKHFQFENYDDISFCPSVEEATDDVTDIFSQYDVWAAIDESECSWWEKELFKRKVLEDKTLVEIATEEGLTVGQVYYSYKKVKESLKQILEKNIQE